MKQDFKERLVRLGVISLNWVKNLVETKVGSQGAALER